MENKKQLELIISPIFGLLATLILIFATITFTLEHDYSRKINEYHTISYTLNQAEKDFRTLINLHEAQIYYILSKKNPKLKKKLEDILENLIKQTSNKKLKQNIKTLLKKIQMGEAKDEDFDSIIKYVEKILDENMKRNNNSLFSLKFQNLEDREKELYWELEDLTKTFVTENKIPSKDCINHVVKSLNFYNCNNYLSLPNQTISSYNFQNQLNNLIDYAFINIQKDFHTFLQKTKKSLEKKEKELVKKERFYGEISFISFIIALSFIIYSFFLFIEEKRKLEKAIIKDVLTNTFNKETFYDIVKDKTGYIIILDLVKFKRFNEIYGRKYGDNLLKILADRIYKIFKPYNPIISRFWANTFVVFLPTHDAKFKDYNFLKKIKEALEKPIFLDSKFEYVPKFTLIVKEKTNCAKCSIKNVCDFFSLIEFIEDYAKNHSKGSILIYESNEDFRSKLQDIVEKEKTLARAIKEDRIIAYFQPIVDSKTYKPYAFECLARIVDGNRVLSVGTFIDIAIETGLILDVDIKMLKYISKIRRELPIKLFINLSPRSLYSKHIVDELKNIYLGNTVFEITEQFIVENVVQLERLRKELDLDFAVDDFGSGFSSLHTVLDLSSRGIIKYLKIDGSLVQDVVNNKQKQEIIETIVIMARKLNLKTIAEFVENEESAKILNKLGVDFLQGFYFAPPMPLEEAKAYLQKAGS